MLYATLIKKKSTTSWILDSSAFDHVSSSLNLFNSYQQITLIIVRLPTGQQVIATHSGTVQIYYSLSLFNVLYLPDFNFNLISISKLTFSLYSKLIFSANNCFIQAENNLKKIGTVYLVDGLYKLAAAIVPENSVRYNIVASTFSCNKQKIDLWHFCLGHPSHDRLVVIKQSFLNIFSNKSFVCDTCHYAKQKKLPFLNSTSLSPKPFSLIHVDIWGPSHIL